jgi:hypothetical protein
VEEARSLQPIRFPPQKKRRVVDRNMDADETPAKYTINGRRAACCARAASGHAAAAPPSSVMNSRRFISRNSGHRRDMRLDGQYEGSPPISRVRAAASIVP